MFKQILMIKNNRNYVCLPDRYKFGDTNITSSKMTLLSSSTSISTQNIREAVKREVIKEEHLSEDVDVNTINASDSDLSFYVRP